MVLRTYKNLNIIEEEETWSIDPVEDNEIFGKYAPFNRIGVINRSKALIACKMDGSTQKIFYVEGGTSITLEENFSRLLVENIDIVHIAVSNLFITIQKVNISPQTQITQIRQISLLDELFGWF